MIDLGDGARLRRATIDDLGAVLRIKLALPMPSSPPRTQTRQGGFLLGCDEAHYAQLLRVARVWLLELDGHPGGFSVTMDDPMLRASPLWARRDAIQWRANFDHDAAAERRVAYFDQLAVLPRLRAHYWGAALGLRALAEQIEELGHELVLTTTVIAPIDNLAALPYLERIGARRVGQVDEHYAGVGQVVSAVHMLEAPRYHEQFARLRGSDDEPATPRMQRVHDIFRIIESSLSR